MKLILQLLTILLQTFCKTNCRSTHCALVAETNLIARSDDLQSRKRGQSVQFFSFNLKKKVPQKYCGTLIWKYRCRGAFAKYRAHLWLRLCQILFACYLFHGFYFIVLRSSSGHFLIVKTDSQIFTMFVSPAWLRLSSHVVVAIRENVWVDIPPA